MTRELARSRGLRPVESKDRPTSSSERHTATSRATGASTSERAASAHLLLAELFSEAADVHRELAQIQLDVSATSMLMEDEPAGPPRLLTVKQVAELVGVDERTIRRWRDEEKLPPAITIGGVIRWYENDILDWLDEAKEMR